MGKQSNKSRPARRKLMTAEERRNQLLRIAMELFADRGFTNTTTKAIATAAGVSEGVIFKHFPSKAALYTGILDYKAKQVEIQPWIAQLREFTEREDDAGVVLAVVKRILESYRQDSKFQKLMLRAALNAHPLTKLMAQRLLPLHKFLRDYIKRRQKKGAFRRCDPNLAVHAIVSMPSYYGLEKELFRVNNLKLTEDQMAAGIAQLILEGLQASSNP